MLKLYTPVDCGQCRFPLTPDEKILVIGSCFADGIGAKLSAAGFNACVNPFGTLYNPVSVCNSLLRLSCGAEFTPEDCVAMGSGSDLICSFSHHTSFARGSREEFLENANASLRKASEFFKDCTRVIVTLGTAWCFRSLATGEIVSNCLKRDAREFSREMLSVGQCVSVLSRTLSRLSKGCSRKFIFTVSPIRHHADGAHGNQLSKSTLLLSLDTLLKDNAEVAEYFPAYEIVLDELRDYRFYSRDLVHPSEVAVDYIWERFQGFAFSSEGREVISSRERLFRQSQHRPLH